MSKIQNNYLGMLQERIAAVRSLNTRMNQKIETLENKPTISQEAYNTNMDAVEDSSEIINRHMNELNEVTEKLNELKMEYNTYLGKHERYAQLINNKIVKPTLFSRAKNKLAETGQVPPEGTIERDVYDSQIHPIFKHSKGGRKSQKRRKSHRRSHHRR